MLNIFTYIGICSSTNIREHYSVEDKISSSPQKLGNGEYNLSEVLQSKKFPILVYLEVFKAHIYTIFFLSYTELQNLKIRKYFGISKYDSNIYFCKTHLWDIITSSAYIYETTALHVPFNNNESVKKKSFINTWVLF